MTNGLKTDPLTNKCIAKSEINLPLPLPLMMKMMPKAVFENLGKIVRFFATLHCISIMKLQVVF